MVRPMPEERKEGKDSTPARGRLRPAAAGRRAPQSGHRSRKFRCLRLIGEINKRNLATFQVDLEQPKYLRL